MIFVPSKPRYRAKIWKMGVSKTSDYIHIKIKMKNPNQEPPASSKATNQDSATWKLIYSQCSEFLLSFLILNVQPTYMSLKSWFVALEDAGGSWLRFGFLILNFIWSLDFGTPMHWILNLYIDFEDAENIHVLLVLILGFEDTGGSWLRFGILILIWIWSLVFSTPMFWILALYLDFEGAKNIHVL